LGAAMAGAVILGFTVYVALVAIFWTLSGRPESAEAIVLGRARQLLRSTTDYLQASFRSK